MKIEKKINNLIKKYSLFSQEHDLVGEVRFWIKDAIKSSIPDCALNVAEGRIERYENSIARNNPNDYLIKELKNIVKNAFRIYYNAKTLEKITQ